MSYYQKIEYRIGPDGQITETVLNGDGQSCTLATAPIEAALGSVLQRDLLPEYHQDPQTQAGSPTQQITGS